MGNLLTKLEVTKIQQVEPEQNSLYSSQNSLITKAHGILEKQFMLGIHSQLFRFNWYGYVPDMQMF